MKKGISLTILVVTIIVMIIIASSVLISLSNNGIIDRATQVVDKTNEKQVRDLSMMVWDCKFLEGKRGDELKEEVLKELEDYTDSYYFKVTDSGITVIRMDDKVPTLGSQVTALDYGKTINYSVTVGEKTYSDWKIYYEDETNGYVYIIADSIATKSLGKKENSIYTGYGDASALTADELALYKKFKLGQDGYILNSENPNIDAVAYLITDFADFANKDAIYGSYVEGAMGGPTLELMCAGWNAWNEAKKAVDATHTYTELIPSSDASWNGYKVNGETIIEGITSDGFYINPSYYYWLVSPAATNPSYVMMSGCGSVFGRNLYHSHSIRPVVCLKSSAPVLVETEYYDFELMN